MDLVIKRGKKRRGGEGRHRVMWGGLTLTSALEIWVKLEGMRVWEYRRDVDSMWDRAASCIKDTAREWNEEVKKRVETKKGTYVKLVESKNEEEKRMSMDEYKLAKKEAKLAVMAAKTTSFVSLHKGLEEKDGEKRLFRLAKVEEVCKAIRKMQRSRAMGPDNIPVEFWKFSCGAGLRWLTNLFNIIFKSAKMPEA
ncbi:uncharacterized protein LOC124896686 [Capsicum annuum]|uniref:uncharacterized protein LOC124896686 n=1 Tax=Capsicum annuum TaxID=4072 RepID=UPI001FB07C92|nr:uncharacterized protein LOC124896686 [Capsicum annuum]